MKRPLRFADWAIDVTGLIVTRGQTKVNLYLPLQLRHPSVRSLQLPEI